MSIKKDGRHSEFGGHVRNRFQLESEPTVGKQIADVIIIHSVTFPMYIFKKPYWVDILSKPLIYREYLLVLL